MTKTEMIGLMAGDKKLLKKFAPKEPKIKNKNGCFVVKTNVGYFLQDENFSSNNTVKNKDCAYKFDNFDLAKEKAMKYNGKVVRYWRSNK